MTIYYVYNKVCKLNIMTFNKLYTQLYISETKQYNNVKSFVTKYNFK